MVTAASHAAGRTHTRSRGGCVDGTRPLVAPWSAGSQFNLWGAARQCVPPSMGIVLSLRGWRPVEGPGDPPSKGLSSTLAKHTHILFVYYVCLVSSERAWADGLVAVYYSNCTPLSRTLLFR